MLKFNSKLLTAAALSAALLAGCGGSSSSGVVDSGPTPGAPDSFFVAVSAVIATTSEATEPREIDSIVATSPDNTEPSALGS